MVDIAHAAKAAAVGTAIPEVEIACAADAASVSTAANPAFPFASVRIGATAATVIGAMAIGAIVDRTEKSGIYSRSFFACSSSARSRRTYRVV